MTNERLARIVEIVARLDALRPHRPPEVQAILDDGAREARRLMAEYRARCAGVR